MSVSVYAQRVQKIVLNKGHVVLYDLDAGTYVVVLNGKPVVRNAYAVCHADKLYDSRKYASRKYSQQGIMGLLGKGVRHVVTLEGDGLPVMQEVFEVYYSKGYFLAQVRLKAAGCDYMAPLVSDSVQLYETGSNRALFVPYDNDMWARYNAMVADTAQFTSGEVSALYNNNSRHALVVGSVDHNDWKSGVRVQGMGRGRPVQLSVFGGYADKVNTHDEKGHGQVVSGKDGICCSPRMLVGWFADWRTGLETYGSCSHTVEAPYVFRWTRGTPMGWNSWGSMQDHLTSAKAHAVVDFFADSCRAFRTADSTLYIDLDSYWDNLTVGGIGGDVSQLKAFCQYCVQKGFKPGVYWGPFIDWGRSERAVEGDGQYRYEDTWTRANGQPLDIDGGRAMDPTHPGTRARMAYFIQRLKACGFQMIKIDFLTHGAMEADHYYDTTVHTGMQAFRKGMEYLVDQLGGQMLIYAAISPNLATARYAHMRRIACDAFKRIDETGYTLNSTSYGWWLNRVYAYNDADHVVFGGEPAGANRARLISAIVTGTLITGDDYSGGGEWSGAAKALLQNKALLMLVHNGRGFRPVEGNSGTLPVELFQQVVDGVTYVAVVNCGNAALNVAVDLSRFGYVQRGRMVKVMELFTGFTTSVSRKLVVSVAAADAAIYRLD